MLEIEYDLFLSAGILIYIALLLIGFASYYIYKKHNPKKSEPKKYDYDFGDGWVGNKHSYSILINNIARNISVLKPFHLRKQIQIRETEPIYKTVKKTDLELFTEIYEFINDYETKERLC